MKLTNFYLFLLLSISISITSKAQVDSTSTELILTESDISFNMMVGDSTSVNPFSHNITVANTDNDSLENVSYECTDDWLSVNSIINEGNEQNFAVNINSTAEQLTYGYYTGEVIVRATDADSVVLSVFLTVRDYSKPFIEVGGLVVIECESTELKGDWAIRTKHSDYKGFGYINFEAASTNFNANNVAQTIEYKFEIITPGTYKIKIRNYIPDDNQTEHNDVFFKIDDNSSWKTFSHTNWQWNWQFMHDGGTENFFETEYELSAGVHTLYLTGRSQNFALDRIHIYKSTVTDPLNENIAESIQWFDSPVIAPDILGFDLNMDENNLSSISDNNMSVNISNPGLGNLTNFTADCNVDWIDITIINNGENDYSITASVNENAEDLTVGQHITVIELNADDAETANIQLSLTVENPNVLELNILSATASYTEGSYSPSNAIDGSMASRWGSNGDPAAPNGWIYFDLGGITTINKLTINWEAAYALAYKVQVSDDASTWETVATITNSDGSLDEVIFSAEGRYIRIYGQTMATAYAMSIYEVSIFGLNIPIEISENLENNEIQIYPNPAGKNFNIKTTAETQLFIYKNDGTLVYEKSLNIGINVIENSLLSGVYLVKLLNNKDVSIEKRLIIK